MVRDKQNLLGWLVIEATDESQQEVRVIGDSSKVVFDYVLETRVAAYSG